MIFFPALLNLVREEKFFRETFNDCTLRIKGNVGFMSVIAKFKSRIGQ